MEAAEDGGDSRCRYKKREILGTEGETQEKKAPPPGGGVWWGQDMLLLASTYRSLSLRCSRRGTNMLAVRTCCLQQQPHGCLGGASSIVLG